MHEFDVCFNKLLQNKAVQAVVLMFCKSDSTKGKTDSPNVKNDSPKEPASSESPKQFKFDFKKISGSGYE